MSEAKIVEEIMQKYTKMLPDAEDPVRVNIEMHVQVGLDLSTFNQ